VTSVCNSRAVSALDLGFTAASSQAEMRDDGNGEVVWYI